MTLGENLTTGGFVTMVVQPITYLFEVLTINLVLGFNQMEQFGLMG